MLNFILLAVTTVSARNINSETLRHHYMARPKLDFSSFETPTFERGETANTEVNKEIRDRSNESPDIHDHKEYDTEFHRRFKFDNDKGTNPNYRHHFEGEVNGRDLGDNHRDVVSKFYPSTGQNNRGVENSGFDIETMESGTKLQERSFKSHDERNFFGNNNDGNSNPNTPDPNNYDSSGFHSRHNGNHHHNDFNTRNTQNHGLNFGQDFYPEHFGGRTELRNREDENKRNLHQQRQQNQHYLEFIAEANKKLFDAELENRRTDLNIEKQRPNAQIVANNNHGKYNGNTKISNTDIQHNQNTRQSTNFKRNENYQLVQSNNNEMKSVTENGKTTTNNQIEHKNVNNDYQHNINNHKLINQHGENGRNGVIHSDNGVNITNRSDHDLNETNKVTNYSERAHPSSLDNTPKRNIANENQNSNNDNRPNWDRNIESETNHDRNRIQNRVNMSNENHNHQESNTHSNDGNQSNKQINSDNHKDHKIVPNTNKNNQDAQNTTTSNQKEIKHRNHSQGKPKSNPDMIGEQWIWGSGDTTTPTMLDNVTLDDRAAFSGDKCATGKIKVGNMCRDVD